MDESVIADFLLRDARLIGALTFLTGNRAGAEEAVQEALARAWEQSERGVHIESLQRWVAAVAFNVARRTWRRARLERDSRERIAVEFHHNVDSALDLDRALQNLPRRQREAVVLRYYLSMDVREIAATLSVGEGTIKTALHRARNSLAVALEAHEEDKHVEDR